MAGGGNAIRGSRVGAGPMGEAERGEAVPPGGHLLLLARPPLRGDLRRRGPGPRLMGLPALRPAREPRLGEPAAGPQDRALQDPPGLRQGAPLRRRGRDHPRRGPRPPPLPPQVRRHHLLTLRALLLKSPVDRVDLCACRPETLLSKRKGECCRSLRNSDPVDSDSGDEHQDRHDLVA